jgi:hypothetical protein
MIGFASPVDPHDDGPFENLTGCEFLQLVIACAIWCGVMWLAAKVFIRSGS